MTEDQWLKKLAEIGYKNLRVCDINTNGEKTPNHTHDVQTAHVILDGEVTLIDDNTLVLKKGEFYEIPQNTTHKAQTPKTGCKMIVGEKPE